MSTMKELKIEEKSKWYFIADKLDNSYCFIVSKVKDTAKNTELIILAEDQVFKITKDEFLKNYKDNKIVEGW